MKIKFTDFDTSVSEIIDYSDELNWKEPVYGMTEETKEKWIDKLKITIANNPGFNQR